MFHSLSSQHRNSPLAGLPPTYHPTLLQMIENEAARLVSNLSKVSPITSLLCSLHWLLVAAGIRFQTLMLGYKAKNGPPPTVPEGTYHTLLCTMLPLSV